MKKWITLVLTVLMLLSFSTAVLASNGAEIDIQDGPPPSSSDSSTSHQEQNGALVPSETRMETIGDIPYIIKEYNVAPGNGIPKFQESFTQDGFAFTQSDISKRSEAGQFDSKTVDEEKSAEVPSNDKAKLLADLPKEMKYSQDGYTGVLTLKENSIVFESNGQQSYTYTVTDTRVYPGLPRNDNAYVDKTVVKNGVTLQLQSVEWTVTATTPADDALVPSQYTATATYSGTATGSRAGSYTATYTYSGVVKKELPGNTIYTVTYRGQAIPVQVTSEPEQGQEVKAGKSPVPFIILSVTALLIGGTAAITWLRVKKRRQMADALTGWDDDATLEDEDGAASRFFDFDKTQK